MLIRVQQIELFLIDDRIKLFNLIKSKTQDWYIAVYHDYLEDMKFDENIEYTLQWQVIV